MFRTAILISAVFSLSLLFVGCPTTGDDDDDAAGGEVTFTADVMPIITQYCSCHTGDAGGSGGIALDTYAGITTTAANGVCSGDRADCVPTRLEDGSMPLDGCLLDQDGCITSGDLAVIQAWLDDDAPE